MSQKTVYIASDHAGYPIKEFVITELKELGCVVKDLGPSSDDRVDYPDFADKVCTELQGQMSAAGVLICGSGQGMAMRANKYLNIRAALCWDRESASLSRQHNDANVLCLGARLLEKSTIQETLQAFVQTEFEGGRHQNRVQKISSNINQ